MSVFVAIDLLIILEHAVTVSGAHEVIVALTRGQAAAHCGTRLVAAFTSLLSEIESREGGKQH